MKLQFFQSYPYICCLYKVLFKLAYSGAFIHRIEDETKNYTITDLYVML